MSQRMLARYYLLPTIGLLSLCTFVWGTYVTRLFGVLFRLFQSCPYDYQTNGARVCATGIVGILTLVLLCSPLLLIVVLWHGIIFTACINSESTISQEEFDTQVITSVCLMQLVYPWIHLKLLLICVSKMSDLYQNTEDSHPTASTWVHIDMSALHFFLTNSFCSMEYLLRPFNQLLWKNPGNLLMKLVETLQQLLRSSLFVFNVSTILYNLSRYLFLFSIYKHNDLVQSEQKYWSQLIPELVNLWCNKYSPPSGVIKFGESFFMMVAISL